jgi:hypothetical protein
MRTNQFTHKSIFVAVLLLFPAAVVFPAQKQEHGRKGGVPGWTVVFRYSHRSSKQERRNGRALTMNSEGSDLRVEHVDFILKYVERKL